MYEHKTILTEQECSDRIGLSRATLWRLRSAEKISYYKSGTRILYDEKHIQEFLQRQERPAKLSKKTRNTLNLKDQPAFGRIESSE